jgi:hypothetical protein
MKKKSLKLRLPYFFGQRIHRRDSSGNMPELIQPETELQRAESGIEDVLRWADDGGKMLDLRNRTARSDPDDARHGEPRDEC